MRYSSSPMRRILILVGIHTSVVGEPGWLESLLLIMLRIMDESIQSHVLGRLL